MKGLISVRKRLCSRWQKVLKPNKIALYQNQELRMSYWLCSVVVITFGSDDFTRFPNNPGSTPGMT